MIAEPSKLSVEDFVDLLHQLDAFIGSKNPEFQLDIKAIGGFSMMYHEKETSLKMLRKGSSDIDTLTMLPKQVATMVDIIATNNGVSPDWLNNRSSNLILFGRTLALSLTTLISKLRISKDCSCLKPVRFAMLLSFLATRMTRESCKTS